MPQLVRKPPVARVLLVRQRHRPRQGAAHARPAEDGVRSPLPARQDERRHRVRDARDRRRGRLPAGGAAARQPPEPGGRGAGGAQDTPHDARRGRGHPGHRAQQAVRARPPRQPVQAQRRAPAARQRQPARADCQSAARHDRRRVPDVPRDNPVLLRRRVPRVRHAGGHRACAGAQNHAVRPKAAQRRPLLGVRHQVQRHVHLRAREDRRPSGHQRLGAARHQLALEPGQTRAAAHRAGGRRHGARAAHRQRGRRQSHSVRRHRPVDQRHAVQAHRARGTAPANKRQLTFFFLSNKKPIFPAS